MLHRFLWLAKFSKSHLPQIHSCTFIPSLNLVKMQANILKAASILWHYLLSSYWRLSYVNIIKESHKEIVIVFLIPISFPFSPQVTKLSLFYSKNICVRKRTHLGLLEVRPKPIGVLDCSVNVFTVSVNICPPILSSLSVRSTQTERAETERVLFILESSPTLKIAMYLQKAIIRALNDTIARLCSFTRKLWLKFQI